MSTHTPPAPDPNKAPLLQGAALRLRPGVVHGFTTRAGGCSVGPLASLNLAQRAGEAEANLRENWRRVLAALHPDLVVADLALISQVHGASVLRVERGGGPLSVLGEADAAVTTTPGVTLAVRVADCVPVVYAAPGGVAVAHAGWRGTVGGVAQAALRALCEATGCAPGQVQVAVGPHISGDAFEVGPEVVQAMRATGLSDEVFLRDGPRRHHVDLGAAVQALLEAEGATVDRVAGCTFTEGRFFSHRREGPPTGRLAGVVALCC